MSRAELSAAARESLQTSDVEAPFTVAGFDGFVDHIIKVVDKRQGRNEYQPMATISDFGGRITDAAGHSANFELVVRQTKIGGNGPIMANALVRLGHPLTYIGILGDGQIHPAFAPLAEGAEEIISLGAPASTDALEFDDGKLMLGKLEALESVNVENVRETIGEEKLRGMISKAGLIATVNWTMLLEMNAIWRYLREEILSAFPDHRPLWFVDLADPAKRDEADLCAALETIGKLQEESEVILGLNEAEARQVLAAIGETWTGGKEDLAAAEKACQTIRAKLGVHRVVCHQVKGAAAASATDSAAVAGFYDPKPFITTGAGDHFNAGYCFALAAGIEEAQALLIGTATSGFYVRGGVSPTRQDLINFLQEQGVN